MALQAVTIQLKQKALALTRMLRKNAMQRNVCL